MAVTYLNCFGLFDSKYKCTLCGFKWWEGHRGPTVCLRCGHEYVIWLNYKKLRRKYFKKDERMR